MQPLYWGIFMTDGNYLKVLIFSMAIGATPLAVSEELAKSLNVLTLRELESEMINQSLDIKIKSYEVDAAKEKREALPSNHIPRLTLDGNFKYLSEIPEINMAPGRTLKFGDNKNYSIGPTLSMTIFDFNSKENLQTSLDKNLSSKENEAKGLKANILFKVRFHYLNIVFLQEKRNLISESLKVANKQLKDVIAKNRFGSGSKLDLLTAQKEVHELESQLKEIDFNVTAEQIELYKITFHQKIKNADLIGNTNRLENLNDLQSRFMNYKQFAQDAGSNAKVKSMKDLSDSFESQAQSISKQRYPKINLIARTSLDYPNGPDLNAFNQNTIGVSLSMPLFDGGEISHNVNEKNLQAMALKTQAINEERNINESVFLATKRIENLQEQNEIIQKKTDETSEIAYLMYKSYQDGRATFIEVERANVKRRESKLSLSSNQYQIILNLIQLANVAGE